MSEDQGFVDADAEAGVPPPTRSSSQPDAGPGPGSPSADIDNAPAKGAKTLADGPVGDDPAPKTGDFPDDWREKLAGDNKALLNTLKRYSSPQNYARAGFEAQQKIRSGEFKRMPAPDAPDEEKAAWRKEAGIPEKPEDYKIETPNGYVFGEADKPVLESFKAHAHSKDWTPAQLNQAVEWYTKEQEQIIARMQEQDEAFRSDADDKLRQEWGADYRRNLNAVQNLLASAPSGVPDRLLAGRMSDGKMIGNDPAVLSWLAQIAKEVSPAAALVPAGTQNAPKAVDARITEIQNMMGTDEYWKNPKLQEEYRELVSARDAISARQAA